MHSTCTVQYRSQNYRTRTYVQDCNHSNLPYVQDAHTTVRQYGTVLTYYKATVLDYSYEYDYT